MPNRDRKWVVVLAIAGLLMTTSAGCGGDPPTPGSSACGGQPLKVDLKPVSTEVEGASATYPEIRVAPVCDGMAGAAVLQQAANVAIADVRADWTEIWQEQHAELPDARGSFDVAASVPVNVPGLVVITTDTQTLAGGPYPNSTLSSVALNTSTGELLTREAMLAEMQETGGPKWNFERELRRAARDALPAGAELITDLKRDDVSFYPTRDGLAVSADGYFPHVIGPAHFTIPWPRLVGEDDDLRFVPDAWGH